MEKTGRRPWAAWLTASVMLVLLLAPATGWLVRSQMQRLVSPFPWLLAFMKDIGIKETVGNVTGDPGFADRLRNAADRLPDDCPAQIARSVGAPNRTAALRALVPRFPANPSLYASILRFAAQNEVRLTWKEPVLPDARSALPDGKEIMTGGGEQEFVPAPDRLAAYEQDAARGEQLDPDNAFFPAMRAAGLFAARRDREALDVLRLAAAKPRWNDYVREEVLGKWRLLQAASGDRSVIPRAALLASVLLPHYAQMRNLARVAMLKAVAAERASRAGEGLAIRRDVMRLGSLMRTQSTFLLGSIAGADITQLALLRPGGAPSPEEARYNLKPEERRKTLDAWSAYLRRIGRSGEEFRAREAFGAGEQVRRIVEVGRDQIPSFQPMLPLVGWWLAGLFLLSNALWMLLLGGAAARLARTPRMKAGRPLPRYARRAILAVPLVAAAVVGLFFGVQAVANRLDYYPEPETLAIALGCAAVLPAAILLVAGFAKRRFDFLFGLAVFLLTPLCLFLLFRLGMWQAQAGQGLAALGYELAGPDTQCLGGPPIPWKTEMAVLSWFWFPLTFLLPIASALVFGGVSLFCRTPLAVGMVRGFRGMAVPVACFLLLVYALTVPFTAREEARLNAELARSTRHEGRYLAARVGCAWPGDGASAPPLPPAPDGESRPCR
jgi:hypothetical protein